MAAASAEIWERYGAYLEAPPHQVMEWNDRETGARGWLVINSLRGGAAGGGTRMRTGVTREEVTYLAKAMQLKFAFSGSPIGGGKSGIDFDPSDPRREDVLRRWFTAIHPVLTTRYGTGGDVGVDEQKDVQRLCAELGLSHPQEGIVRGHLGLSDDGVQRALSALRAGLCQPAGPEFGVRDMDLTVSDLITGYGVVRAAQRLYEHRGESLEGVRCVVEGFGNVGAAAALYLTRKGAHVVGIVCGANQPFGEVRLGETLTAQAADAEFEVMPEIVASLGAARAFDHLMTHPGEIQAADVFRAVRTTMDEAVDAVMERVGRKPSGVMASAIASASRRAWLRPTRRSSSGCRTNTGWRTPPIFRSGMRWRSVPPTRGHQNGRSTTTMKPPGRPLARR
ncbi:MAG: Glu/Leu/Phe/Val dehydrogenase dimerization domain-containing protein [Longimicrobiales bacterium]|nr:Glu/Leu/Phe/Val dehydrogenase dimerization domain-containing protein [Longimicrobiales bacterium]